MSLLRSVVVSESQDRAMALWRSLPAEARPDAGDPRVIVPSKFLAQTWTDVGAVYVDPDCLAQFDEAAFRAKAELLVAASAPVSLVKLA